MPLRKQARRKPAVRDGYLPFGQPNFGDEEIAAVTAVLKSRWIGMGAETEKFEAELARFAGAKHVVTVNSCTSALFLSLLVHGVGPGDEVIVPSLTWCSTANVAFYLGAKPVFCDVNRSTFCTTPETVAERITPRTKAVIVVHLGGLTADVAAIGEILPPGVALIEDAAHALGSSYGDGSRVGSSGNLACFSFYANKNLSTGEGGAIALSDDHLARRLRSLRQNGLDVDAWKRFTDPRAALTPTFEEIGYKVNFTDFQASVGRAQLRRQGEFHSIRHAIASEYVRALGLSQPAIQFQKDVLSDSHARHLVMVALPIEDMSMTRDDIVLEMRNRKIGASIHYRPLHTIPLYKDSVQAPLPNTDWIGRRVMTLPVSANMTMNDTQYVVEHFLDVLDG